ncbi:YadA family autotransporter adhesin [Xanthomonas citri]|uniref:YadA family autotransporter adhesin n=1 Tax=Xanthomonas citri TaxID=346 RepID=UPI003CCE7988
MDSQLTSVNSGLTSVNSGLADVVSGTTGVVQRGDSATAKDTVVLTSSSGSAAKPGAAQKLSNLAVGSVDSGSTDAITGGQLYTQQQRVDSYLGGGADVAAGTTPSYTIQKSAYKSVDTAFGAVDKNLTALNESVVSGTTGVVQRGDSATAKDTVVLTSSSTSSSGSAASPGTAQKLSNLAAGSVASTSTDAITGGQLYTQQQSVNSYLGGGANIASNIAPSYTIQKKVYSDVGSAFTALDNKLTDLSGSVISGGGGVVQRAEASNTLVLTESGGSVADPGSTQRLSNLSAGAVSASSTDAINGAQLFAINQQLSETNESLLAMQDGLASVTASVAEISIGAGGGSVSGQGANADGAGAAAYGDNSNASGADATAIGENTIASGDQSTASGSGAQATGDKASAYGESSVASGDSSSAIGAGAIASGANATAIGAGSNASADNSVALGAGSVADRENTVSVGSASGARQITNVAAGT